jgi:hypothetical protein
VPNNATLVVVGDVTPDEVKTLAQRYFGPIARRDVPPAKIPLELAEPGERQITLHVKTQLPSLMLAFNVPSIATAEDKRSVNALRLISALRRLYPWRQPVHPVGNAEQPEKQNHRPGRSGFVEAARTAQDHRAVH